MQKHFLIHLYNRSTSLKSVILMFCFLANNLQKNVTLYFYHFFVLTETQERYRDVLGTDFFNCCWMIRLPCWAVRLGKVIGNYFDVVKFLFSVEIAIVVLQLGEFAHKEELLSKLYDFHHLCVVPMCTIVGLYMIFKQRRPCYDTKNHCQIGTLYGMPSGDALFSAIVGCHIGQKNIALGAAFVLAVCFSRVSRGYHTVLQTIVGSTLGVSLYFLSKICDERFVIVNWVFALFLPLLSLFEPKLKNARKFDTNNMHSWIFVDAGCLVFDFINCAPNAYNFFLDKTYPQRLFITLICWTTSVFIGYYIGLNGISLTIV